jgi:hypothetical protein
MRPLFTIHAGEYLVGLKLEQDFPDLRVWIPSKDTGIDLLVTTSDLQKVASLQVKYSKDYLAVESKTKETSALIAGGWWTFNPEKLEKSEADLWVLTLYRPYERKFDFVVIPPAELLSHYRKLTRDGRRIQSYVVVTSHGRCWENRGASETEMLAIQANTYENPDRDFSAFLNAWPFRYLARKGAA